MSKARTLADHLSSCAQEFSPGDLSHELNVSRATYAEMGIEAAIVGGCCDGRAQIRGRLCEIRVIEGIEEAGSEFKGNALRQAKRPLQRNVPVVQAGRHNRVARTIPERSWSRRSERAGENVRLREIR